MQCTNAVLSIPSSSSPRRQLNTSLRWQSFESLCLIFGISLLVDDVSACLVWRLVAAGGYRPRQVSVPRVLSTMRLLHTMSLKLEEFYGDEIPTYAILSHRWEKEEVTFKDMIKAKAEGKIGYSKIVGCCRKASAEGYKYVWIDTCCIDKSSSAELSEAINSMFAWYRNANVCYVYLSDVPHISDQNDGDEHFLESSHFRRSQWFSRGWTLQELLAPGDVEFLDESWQLIGDRSSLSFLLSEIQGISQYHLHTFEDASVAQKMSWISNRKTTKVEDLAYCMLGIFGVFMPPLYGEGENAFTRLQLEIMKISDDESIFAWNSTIEDSSQFPKRSLLARSPGEFRNCREVVRHSFSQTPAYSMTNKGLHITLPMIEFSLQRQNGADHLFEAALNCKRGDTKDPVVIYLTRSKSVNGNTFTRLFSDCNVIGDWAKRYTYLGDTNYYAVNHTPLFVPEPRNSPTVFFDRYVTVACPQELQQFHHSVLFDRHPACGTWLDRGNGHSRIRVTGVAKSWVALVFGPTVAPHPDSITSAMTWTLGIVAMSGPRTKIRLESISTTAYNSDLPMISNRAIRGENTADEENNATRALREHVIATMSKDIDMLHGSSVRNTSIFVPDWNKTLHMKIEILSPYLSTLNFQLS